MAKPLVYISGLIILLATSAMVLEVTQDTTSTPTAALSFNEFDEIIQTPISFITPVELADELMRQEQHYNLFDLRQGAMDYRIPTAEPLTAAQIVNKKIPVNEVIWLYSENESEALQVYYLLLIRGYFKVKVLSAGMQGWRRQILFPNAELIPPNQQVQRRAITEFFGGNFAKHSANFSPKPVPLVKKQKKHHGC